MLEPAALVAFVPDQGLGYYLLLGMVATVNPCGFAMLPAYLSYFLGLDEAGTADPRDRSGTVTNAGSVLQALRVAGAVSAGFMVVFSAAGAVVELTSLRSTVYEYAPWVSVVIGFVLMALGAAMFAGVDFSVNLPKLSRGGRERTFSSMFLFGMSYATASIGCTLPIFLAAIAGTMRRESFANGVVAFATYGLGMAVVLGALTVWLARARSSLLAKVRNVRPYLTRIAGGFVALAGAYVSYYGVLELRTYRATGGNIPSSSVTDQVTGWSDTVTDWVTQIGAVRLGLILAGAIALAIAISRATKQRKPAVLASEDSPGTGSSEARTQVS